MMSLVRKHFENRVSHWMQKLPNVEKNWSALLQTLEGHFSYVTILAFSLDGKLLASASGDMAVRLWDSHSGAALHTLRGHWSMSTP